MHVNVSSGMMTFLAALAAALQLVIDQTEVLLNPAVKLGFKVAVVFITVYLGITNRGALHHVPGTSKRAKADAVALPVLTPNVKP